MNERGTHIERLQIVSDAPLPPRRAQAIGDEFGAALDSELAGAGIARLQLGELVLDLRGAPSVAALARHAAAAIIGRQADAE